MKSRLLSMMDGGANPGGLVSQNISSWGAPKADAAVDTSTVVVMPNHALGKTFYRIRDTGGLISGLADNTNERNLAVGESYEVSVLVDTALSVVTSGITVPADIVGMNAAAYSQVLALVFTPATKAVAFSQNGTSFSGISVSATQVSGDIWRVAMAFTMATARPCRWHCFVDSQAGGNTGDLYMAAPVWRRTN